MYTWLAEAEIEESLKVQKDKQIESLKARKHTDSQISEREREIESLKVWKVRELESP